jgi:general L-amino acid transport system permease protein
VSTGGRDQRPPVTFTPVQTQFKPPDSQEPQRVPPWRNVTLLKWSAQIVFVVALLLVAWILVTQAAKNLAARNIDVSFDFLDHPPGIKIAEGIDTQPATGARALYVGIVNMLRVTVAGVIGATILGIIIGVARLSKNWIVNKVATAYIETVRNIPLLVQIIAWSIIITTIPGDTELTTGPFGCQTPQPGCEGWLLVSNKGTSFAWLFPSDGFWQWLAFLAIGVAVSVWVYRWRIRVKEERGDETYALTWGTLTVLGFAAVGWFAHPVMGFLGILWGAIASVLGSVPTVVLQAVLALLALLWAGFWIKHFLDDRRTPAGLAKLNDDDFFRMGTVAVSGVIGAVAVFAFPGVSDWILNAGHDLFRVMEDKFQFLRSGSPLAFSRPSLVQPGNFPNFGTTGLTMTSAFFAVFVGVTIYTASYIAEVVRGGILAISKGQTEAGLALGLHRNQLLRFIILPQAFRIILPPMGNQYLNLAKNTSLGIAIAYPEVVAVGQTIYNQTGQTIPVVTLWMLFYVSVSLFISAIVNWYNRRMALVER